MKISTVKEALASELDEPILAIRGTLTKLYKQMSGEGQYGQWYLQNGVIKDDTGEIKVTFSGREEVPQNWRGKTVELKCTKGTKGGWSGVKRSVNKKDKADILHVSEKAEVLMLEIEQVPEPEKPAPSPPSNGPAKAPSSPPEPAKTAGKGVIPDASEYAAEKGRGPSESDQLAEGMRQVFQIMNAQLAVITLVHNYLVPAVKERTGLTVDPVQEAALVQNCLIQLYYQKGHWNFRQKAYSFGNGSKKEPDPPAPPG
jgi:hypothetical protein